MAARASPSSSSPVIDVDGQEFNFTWASKCGELCDIYEERQSGEGGNGLLMERGSAWHKVNVQPILDESAKNLVKMHSEEAEHLSKSQKTIDENIEEAAASLQIDDPDIFEKIEIGGSPVSAAGNEKVNDNDGKAGTSSESGSDSDSDSDGDSDSDSDSSGSGSDSGSQSRSSASGSGSSSDSDTDASSSSKEGSDAFVDITSDDNKADTACRKVADELKLSSLSRDLPSLDGDDEQIDIGTNLDYKSTSSHISSGSGSDSGSQSRSSASGSGSSSDSVTDASSSSKEGSDAFVDITSDDNKADTACRKVADELKLSSLSRDLPSLDGDDEQIDIGTNLDYKSTSSHIDLNNFNINNDETAYKAAATKNFGASNIDMPSEIPGSENMTSSRSDPSIVDGKDPANKISYQDNLFDDPLAGSSENLPNEEAIQFTKQHGSRRKSTSKDGTNHVTRISDKGAIVSLKRCSGNENATTKPESAKRPKVDTAYLGATDSLAEHRQNLPPGKHINEKLSKETGNVGWNTHTDLQVQDNTPMKGRPSASGNLQKINQSPNVFIQAMHSDGPQEKIVKTSSKKKFHKMQKPLSSMDGNFGKGYVQVDDHHVNFDDSDDSAARKRGRHGGSFLDGKMQKCSKDANIDANSMNLAKGVRGNVNHGVVVSLPECTETNGEPSILQRNSADKSPPGKQVLQREQSDLESGEFREDSLENDIGRTRRQFERNSSSKSLDGKVTNGDNSYPNMNNRKVAPSAFHNQRKPSPQEFSTGGNISQEGLPRKTPGYDFDNNRSQERVNVSQGRHLPRTDNPDSESILYPDRLIEKTGKRETKMAQGGMLDHVDPKKKTTPKLPQNGTKIGIEPRTQKSISLAENEERSRNNSLIETQTGRKRRGNSSDEDNLLFSKYDKEELELEGPIKDFSQYVDYLQEYNKKYEVYSYLNSQIKKTQSEFLKVQEDFNVAKERDKDQYYNIVERIRDMYHESGTRHRLMKKAFVLLHEELQAMKQRIRLGYKGGNKSSNGKNGGGGHNKGSEGRGGGQGGGLSDGRGRGR